MRYYIGVDWADAEHAVWVEDEGGRKVLSRTLPQTAAGFAEWGRWLEERRAEGIETWPCRPKGILPTPTEVLPPMSLSEELKALKTRLESGRPADTVVVMHRAVEELRAPGAAQRV